MMLKEPLAKIKSKGACMGGFVPLLYSIATDYKNLKTIVEIGVRQGTSTLSFLCGLDERGIDAKLYSIDINDCSRVVKDEKLKKYWKFMQGDSKEIVKNWDNDNIDVLLIDGSHQYEDCRQDYLLWETFVNWGGIILMHDVMACHPGPQKVFWEEVHYPKTILPLSKSGLGIIHKTTQQYLDL